MTTDVQPVFPPTPALDAMSTASVRLGTHAIGEFLEWAFGEMEWYFADVNDNPAHDRGNPIEDILAQYAGVDLKECERERKKVLSHARGEYRWQEDVDFNPNQHPETAFSDHRVWAWMNGATPPRWEARGTGAVFDGLRPDVSRSETEDVGP